MGKGDKKSRRGKLFQGSFGVRRPKKKATHVIIPEKPVKEMPKEKEVKVAKPAVSEAKPVKAASPKKEAKPKKSEESASGHE